MDKPLRIIQAVNVRWYNATAWYGLSLSRLLADAGHKVLVLTLPGSPPEARAKELGLDTLSLPLNSANPALFARTAASLSALARNFKPHIVNCHRGEGLFLWGLLKRGGAPFFLVRTRGDQRPPKDNAANRWLHAGPVDALIATNSRTAAQCRDILRLAPDKVRLILGGVDRQRFAPDPEARARLRRALGFAENDMVFGLLGRFDPVKGQRQLMQALRRAKDFAGERPLPRIRLLLMGFAANISRETMENWSRECNLAEETVITGQVRDVPGHINAMDVGVVASQGSEAIARAAFEIMACGVPLLGTDVGVMPDLLEPGALVPAGDTDALAALAARAAGDAAFRGRLLAAQQARLPELSYPAFLEKTLGVYHELLNRPRFGGEPFS